MSVETLTTDATVFIGDVVICLTSDWLIFFRDQGQFSGPHFISGTHQRENVHQWIKEWKINNNKYRTPWISTKYNRNDIYHTLISRNNLDFTSDLYSNLTRLFCAKHFMLRYSLLSYSMFKVYLDLVVNTINGRGF